MMWDDDEEFHQGLISAYGPKLADEMWAEYQAEKPMTPEEDDENYRQVLIRVFGPDEAARMCEQDRRGKEIDSYYEQLCVRHPFMRDPDVVGRAPFDDHVASFQELADILVSYPDIDDTSDLVLHLRQAMSWDRARLERRLNAIGHSIDIICSKERALHYLASCAFHFEDYTFGLLYRYLRRGDIIGELRLP